MDENDVTGINVKVASVDSLWWQSKNLSGGTDKNKNSSQYNHSLCLSSCRSANRLKGEFSIRKDVWTRGIQY